ncbi:Putative rRNA methylase [Alteribacillus persepolensis]|uniref:Putative rRNA methylase n=1 Tax=Alteribacillus persepolensis TaxID=568899 RepID=A0A1G8E2Y1_9BACI|nr:class I SAM-dependent methyltransferase [Alteribacillus persepolensis]SDH64297.1 Putative rRNA methylase [Alteribacillus persepolensis]
MILPGILPFVREIIDRFVTTGSVAIDATAGNGNDTLYLAQTAGSNGKVYSFDIQEKAKQNTMQKLQEQQLADRVSFILDSHEHAASYIPAEEYPFLKAAVFNLGYLPKGDKTITTTGDTTIQAVNSLLSIMPSGSCIVLVIYHGHEEGKKEKQALESYASQLNQQIVHVLRYEFINQQNNPPYIIAMEKK